jgi:hypothetical protein
LREKLIETECFDELNQFGPNNTPTPDLNELLQIDDDNELKKASNGKNNRLANFLRKKFKSENSASNNNQSSKEQQLIKARKKGFLAKLFGLK